MIEYNALSSDENGNIRGAGAETTHSTIPSTGSLALLMQRRTLYQGKVITFT